MSDCDFTRFTFVNWRRPETADAFDSAAMFIFWRLLKWLLSSLNFPCRLFQEIFVGLCIYVV